MMPKHVRGYISRLRRNKVSVLLHPRLLFHVPRCGMLNAHQHEQHDRWDDRTHHEH
jgi:hypothetical protein